MENCSLCSLVRLYGNSQSILCVSFSPSGELLATGSCDGIINIWNAQSGQTIKTLEPHDLRQEQKSFLSQWNSFPGIQIKQVEFSPKENYLGYTQYDCNKIVLYRLSNWVNFTKLNIYTDQVKYFAFSPDENYLVAVDRENIYTWMLQNSELVKIIQINFSFQQYLVISPNIKYLASDRLDVWEVSSGNHLISIQRNQNQSRDIELYLEWDTNLVVFSPNGEYLASASGDGNIGIWSVQSGQKIKTLVCPLIAHDSLVISPDGEYLAFFTKDEAIQVWGFQCGENIKTFTLCQNMGWSLAISPNGEYMACGSRDGSIGLWRLYN